MELHVATRSLPFRPPLASAQLLAWFRARAVHGVVEVVDEVGGVVGEPGVGTGVTEGAAGVLRRTMSLPGGPTRVTLAVGAGHVAATFELSAPADLAEAEARCRRMFDLDVDPGVVDRHLARDPALAPLVRARPGLRVPGTVDPHETALLAVIGQQISTAAARTMAGRLVTRVSGGDVLPGPGPTRLFPTVSAVAEADLDGLGLPRRRAATIRAVAAALADGRISLDVGCDRAEARARLLELPGVGPWTADYVLLRALGDPDAMPATDLVLRQRAAERGIDLAGGCPAWRPWRAYGAQHLWVAGPLGTVA